MVAKFGGLYRLKPLRSRSRVSRPSPKWQLGSAARSARAEPVATLDCTPGIYIWYISRLSSTWIFYNLGTAAGYVENWEIPFLTDSRVLLLVYGVPPYSVT